MKELAGIMDKDIDMSETFFGQYAALQKRNAVAAVLKMSDEEWESLKALREAEAQNATNRHVYCAFNATTASMAKQCQR